MENQEYDNFISMSIYLLAKWTNNKLTPTTQDLKILLSNNEFNIDAKPDKYIQIKTNIYYDKFLNVLFYYIEHTNDKDIKKTLYSLYKQLTELIIPNQFNMLVTNEIENYRKNQAIMCFLSNEINDAYIKKLAFDLMSFKIKPTINNISHIINNIELLKNYSDWIDNELYNDAINDVIEQFSKLYYD